MTLTVKNVNRSVSLSLTILRLVGFWAPNKLSGNKIFLYRCYTYFSFMFLLGSYLISQVIDLIFIWGDLPLMTGVAFLLFTNLAQAAKIMNILCKKERIQAIIDESDLVLREEKTKEGRAFVESCDKETRLMLVFYFVLTTATVTGWASSAEKGQLPVIAWYPYDTAKSPAYELSYLHQVLALFIAAYLNVAKDSLVASLIAQCRCRLQLIGLALRNLCKDIKLSNKILSPDQEVVVSARLNACVDAHQAALATSLLIQSCFSAPTFAQFTVSLVIICVTAFQLTSQTSNLVRFLSMGTYLVNMMFQVFIYCYQGHHLSVESSDIAGAAYECPWYACSTSIRRSLLIVMARTRRIAKITAGGFTTLSLGSFMAIIKASYSLFTLLQQVDERK